MREAGARVIGRVVARGGGRRLREGLEGMGGKGDWFLFTFR